MLLSVAVECCGRGLFQPTSIAALITYTTGSGQRVMFLLSIAVAVELWGWSQPPKETESLEKM